MVSDDPGPYPRPCGGFLHGPGPCPWRGALHVVRSPPGPSGLLSAAQGKPGPEAQNSRRVRGARRTEGAVNDAQAVTGRPGHPDRSTCRAERSNSGKKQRLEKGKSRPLLGGCDQPDKRGAEFQQGDFVFQFSSGNASLGFHRNTFGGKCFYLFH